MGRTAGGTPVRGRLTAVPSPRSGDPAGGTVIPAPRLAENQGFPPEPFLLEPHVDRLGELVEAVEAPLDPIARTPGGARAPWSRVRLSTLSSEACTRALSSATFCALETLFLPAVEIRCKNSGTEYVYTSFEGPECGPS